jgi:hypothetical protein
MLIPEIGVDLVVQSRKTLTDYFIKRNLTPHNLSIWLFPRCLHVFGVHTNISHTESRKMLDEGFFSRLRRDQND